MADTSAATGLTVQQWDDKFFREYLGWNKFAKYFGTSSNSIIQVKEDLTKKAGDSVTFALVNRLTNAAVTGSSTLEGNEEALGSRSHQLTVDQLRNAVRVSVLQEQFSAISLRNAAKPQLLDWMMEETRSDIVTALNDINGVAYGSASEAQKDAWLDDNNDRVLFGNALGNTDATGGTVAYDFSDSLAAVVAGDTLSPAIISLAKRQAKLADPQIRPIRVREAGDEEWYVLFCNSLCFRDLSEDTVMTQANRDARARNMNNPLFTGGDLVWDGVIIREIEQIPVDAGAGGASIDLAPNFLCGAQAIGVGYAMRSNSVEETFDYGDKKGVAIREIRGIDKLRFGTGSGDTDDLKDHGVYTIWSPAVADA
jgi:N4-gp56 family major capsid protein